MSSRRVKVRNLDLSQYLRAVTLRNMKSLGGNGSSEGSHRTTPQSLRNQIRTPQTQLAEQLVADGHGSMSQVGVANAELGSHRDFAAQQLLDVTSESRHITFVDRPGFELGEKVNPPRVGAPSSTNNQRVHNRIDIDEAVLQAQLHAQQHTPLQESVLIDLTETKPLSRREAANSPKQPKTSKQGKAKAAKRAKKKKSEQEPQQLGTTKASETMFRNAIRTELNIIHLAATKANIMISLNGLIISALMISGAFIFASAPWFLVPIGIFMFTSTASILFALLAASPERANLFGSIGDWFVAVRSGQASVFDLRSYVFKGGDRPKKDDRLNLLIFEDRVKLSEDEHWEEMQDLLRNRERVYRKMSDQLYWLGKMANRKFKLLNISYTIFRWGLLFSLVAFVAIRTTTAVYYQLGGGPQTATVLGISELKDIYEPSGVQQLSDGRILVVEDEAKRALSVMSLGEDGTLVENPSLDLMLTRSFGRPLNDLEGLTTDDQDRIYAITSHSTNKEGIRDASREQLLRFEVNGSGLKNVAYHTSLRDELAGNFYLQDQISEMAGEQVNFDKLNIEGLSFHNGQLLLGLRAPKAMDSSIVVPIINPVSIFDFGEAAQFGDPILLDLAGGGIRALSFDPVLGAFLIVNEVELPSGGKTSQLWSWSGNAADQPLPLDLPDIINMKNVESIDSVLINGQRHLLLMSDEGNAKKNEPAKYLILDYDQLD